MKLEEGLKVQLLKSKQHRLKIMLVDIAQNRHRVQTILTWMIDADGEQGFNILMTLLDLLGALCLEFVTSFGSNSSLKLESVSQIYVVIGSIITLIVKALCVLAVVLKTKRRFIISYAVRVTLHNGNVLLSRISHIIGTDVSVLPDEYLYHILIYGITFITRYLTDE